MKKDLPSTNTHEDNANLMRYYPVFLDMHNSNVLILGNNQAAIQKTRLMLKSVANIYVLHEDEGFDKTDYYIEFEDRITSNRINPLTFEALLSHQINFFRIIYQANDEHNYDHDSQQKIKDYLEKARAQKILINTVDIPQECDFITPAIVDRTPLNIAIGTEGIAPVLAQQIKTHLETSLSKNLGGYLRYAKTWRETVLKELADSTARRTFWRQFFDKSFTDDYDKNKETHKLKVQQLIQDIKTDFKLEKSLSKKIIQKFFKNSNKVESKNLVSFVSAGPGDAELMTIKALQKLQQADVIIYDRLVNEDILEYARRDALRINVGKKPNCHSVSQLEINQLLQEHGQKNRFVVRLKGGDSLIFGRINEEILALEQVGIEYDIVPGVTAAIGCAAQTKMPLTNRESLHGIHLLSGHSQHGEPEYDWTQLSKLDSSLVFYMGVKNAKYIQESLLNAGINTKTVVTIIENGLRVNEKVILSNITDFTEAMHKNNIKGPAVIYIGTQPSKSYQAQMQKKLELKASVQY